ASVSRPLQGTCGTLIVPQPAPFAQPARRSTMTSNFDPSGASTWPLYEPAQVVGSGSAGTGLATGAATAAVAAGGDAAGGDGRGDRADARVATAPIAATAIALIAPQAAGLRPRRRAPSSGVSDMTTNSITIARPPQRARAGA